MQSNQNPSAGIAGGARHRSNRRSHPARLWLTRSLILGAALLSTVLLYRTLRQYNLAELLESVRAISLWRLLQAVGWAAASYLCLTFNDWLALRYARKPLPYRTAALTSFVALSFGHNIGFAALSSGAIPTRPEAWA